MFELILFYADTSIDNWDLQLVPVQVPFLVNNICNELNAFPTYVREFDCILREIKQDLLQPLSVKFHLPSVDSFKI